MSILSGLEDTRRPFGRLRTLSKLEEKWASDVSPALMAISTMAPDLTEVTIIARKIPQHYPISVGHLCLGGDTVVGYGNETYKDILAQLSTCQTPNRVTLDYVNNHGHYSKGFADGFGMATWQTTDLTLLGKDLMIDLSLVEFPVLEIFHWNTTRTASSIIRLTSGMNF